MADNRGGVRQGIPGTFHPNRSDLRTPGTPIGPSNLPKGQPYGQATQQAQALRAVPVAPSNPSSGTSVPAQPAQLGPGDVPGLGDPTANPNEPVTAGLPIGPGAGPEALGGLMTQDSVELAIAKALYLEVPNPDLLRYISFLEDSLQF